jgi:hypothetical protein
MTKKPNYSSNHKNIYVEYHIVREIEEVGVMKLIKCISKVMQHKN